MFENLIFAGCSFSTSSSDLSDCSTNAHAWPQYLAQFMSPKIFNNLSMPGGGNKSIAHNLIYYLESKSYLDLEKTFIGFNISGLDRIDTICTVTHPDANKHFSWDKDFGFGWITSGGWTSKKSPFFGVLEKHMGYEQTIIDNCLTVSSLIAFLDFKKVKYRFMLMEDKIYQQGPNWWMQMLRKNPNLIRPDGLNMFEWSKKNNCLMDDRFHPSDEANQYFAKVIFNSLDFQK